VNSTTIKKLIDLNQLFYQTLAVQFSATRQCLQPGVRRILETLPGGARILDLGCGNGELARQLARQGYAGSYTGLDASAGLLEEARRDLTAGPVDVRFLQADLSLPGWEAALQGESFDSIFAFAVLHHLPSAELRRSVLEAVHGLLAPGGRFIHSEWQFLNSPRLAARILPWETIDLSIADVDPGDYLLDWKSGGYGLRYVHHFNEAELAGLAEETGFRVVETFYSDGEGGRLGLYQAWEGVEE
jgi:2-polyprenyl-3-methyl-5-hydroxy-6-metoxy-1,4-benzoquinol methylase